MNPVLFAVKIWYADIANSGNSSHVRTTLNVKGKRAHRLRAVRALIAELSSYKNGVDTADSGHAANTRSASILSHHSNTAKLNNRP